MEVYINDLRGLKDACREANRGATLIVTEVIILDNDTIYFPEGIKLMFEAGAKLCGGTVRLHDTFVHDTMQLIWDGVTFANNFVAVENGGNRNAGTFANEKIRPEWFSHVETDGIQPAIDVACRAGNIVLLAPTVYNVSTTLNCYSNTIIRGTSRGGFDRSVSCGSIIMINFDNVAQQSSSDEPTPAMRFCCLNDSQSSENYKTTCHKFSLSRFFIKNVSSSNVDCTAGLRSK